MTLLEVMISVLIFLLGVIGLVAVMARANQLVNDSEDRNRAALLANEAASLLWQYIPYTTTLPSAVYTAWQTEVASPVNNSAGTTSGLLGLPGGVGTITTNNTDIYGNIIYDITIQWQEPNQATPNHYYTEVVIPPLGS
jgi:type IV pilus assembly protein PilV